MANSMKHEFWAEFNLYRQLQVQNREKNKRLLDAWVERNVLDSPWAQLQDAATRQILLAQVVASTEQIEFTKGNRRRTEKAREYTRAGVLRDNEPSGLFFWYYDKSFPNPEGSFQKFLSKQMSTYIRPIFLDFHSFDLSLFPPGSWAIQFAFTLRKPYLSKDDVDFYILDNPIKKEWVFKVPYVAPSQWKGALRAAMTRGLAAWWQSLDGHAKQKREIRKQFVRRRLQITRLFGNEKGVLVDDSQFEAYLDRVVEDEHLNRWYRRALRCLYAPTGFLAGRLHFYPTFFDRIGLEVINPHPRDTGAGKQPIYFESVPAGASGVFTLLYVPLGAGPIDEATCKQDLAAVARGLHAMLTEYGFGAKTSSGYGVVEDKVKDGMVKINLPDVFKPSPPTARPSTDYAPPEETFLKYLDESGEVKAAFKGSGEGDLMSNSEYKQQGESRGGGSLSEFKRFQGWYLAHGAAWKAARHTQEPAGSEKPPISQEDFETLSELSELANSLQADVMASQHEGGEDA